MAVKKKNIVEQRFLDSVNLIFNLKRNCSWKETCNQECL